MAQSVEFAGSGGAAAAGQELDASGGEEQQGQGGGAAVAAAAGGEAGAVRGAGLEERLQECLLEAFAAGTGAPLGIGRPCVASCASTRRCAAYCSALDCSVCSSHLATSCPFSAEGLMLKSLSTGYEPSRRSDHWLKLKRDYCEVGSSYWQAAQPQAARAGQLLDPRLPVAPLLWRLCAL